MLNSAPRSRFHNGSSAIPGRAASRAVDRGGRIAIPLAALLTLRCASAPAPAPASAPVPAVQQHAPVLAAASGAEEKSSPVEFRKLLLKLPRDLVIGTVQTGRSCTGSGPLTWKTSRESSVGDDLGALLLEELSSAGYTIVGDKETLFDDPHAKKAEYVIAGVIRNVKANVCYANGRKHLGTAEGSLTVDWQVYSHRNKVVALKETTSGSSLLPGAQDEPGEEAVTRAFVSAARSLLANARFHDLVFGRGGDRLPKPEQAPIPVAYEGSAAPGLSRASSRSSRTRG